MQVQVQVQHLRTHSCSLSLSMAVHWGRQDIAPAPPSPRKVSHEQKNLGKECTQCRRCRR